MITADTDSIVISRDLAVQHGVGDGHVIYCDVWANPKLFDALIRLIQTTQIANAMVENSNAETMIESTTHHNSEYHPYFRTDPDEIDSSGEYISRIIQSLRPTLNGASIST